ncbi:MAG TPA: hypothetical protein VFL69_05550 [Marmoricola sp.]|nr:hypothetical protein [Marmoricola sp.]
MSAPMDEGEIAARSLALFLAVAIAFALGMSFCIGAGLLLGTTVLGVLGWRLLGQAARPVHLNVVAGVAVASALVTIWAS